MFGSLGSGEMLLICAIALVVVGPDRLVATAGALGRMWGEFKRKLDDAQRSVKLELDQAGELAALRKIEANNRRIMIETGVLDDDGNPLHPPPPATPGRDVP